MCQFHPAQFYDCQICKEIIHVSFGDLTLAEEYEALKDAGWFHVPATGTLIVCPNCVEPWMLERIARGH